MEDLAKKIFELVDQRFPEQKDFAEAKEQNVAFVDFSATWCGPCKMIAPEIAEIAEEFGAAVCYERADEPYLHPGRQAITYETDHFCGRIAYLYALHQLDVGRAETCSVKRLGRYFRGGGVSRGERFWRRPASGAAVEFIACVPIRHSEAP